jgi:putative addiction module component (TIGR02574 family)
MPTTLADVRKIALALPPEEREILAEELVSSLEKRQLTDIDKAWLKEAERRYRDYKAGKTKGIPAEEVFAELRQTP